MAASWAQQRGVEGASLGMPGSELRLFDWDKARTELQAAHPPFKDVCARWCGLHVSDWGWNGCPLHLRQLSSGFMCTLAPAQRTTLYASGNHGTAQASRKIPLLCLWPLEHARSTERRCPLHLLGNPSGQTQEIMWRRGVRTEATVGQPTIEHMSNAFRLCAQGFLAAFCGGLQVQTSSCRWHVRPWRSQTAMNL